MGKNNGEGAGQEPMMIRALRAAGDRGPEMAAAAAKYDMSPDEPSFSLVRIVVDVDKAVQSASAAAGRIEAAANTVSESIYTGTVKAGADLKGQVEQAGQGVITAAQARGEALRQQLESAITRATTAGSAELKKAVTSLGTAAARSRDDLVQTMQTAAAQAARDEARTALAGKLARSWGAVALSLLLAGGIGAGGALLVARMSGHLTPWGDKIAVRQNGVPACGYIGNTHVCGLQP